MSTTSLPPTVDKETVPANDDLSVAAPFRQMPHNVEAEKALLGAIFTNNRAYETVSEYLKPEHFALLAHGKIFEASGRLIERGQMADATTLHNFFRNDESLSDIGGPTYLDEVTAFAVSVINAGEYGNLIYDLYLKRELINLGEDLVNRAYSGEVDETASDQIVTAEMHLYELATAGKFEGGFKPFKDTIIQAIEQAEAAHKRDGKLAGVTTGFRDMDSLLGGLHRSDLLILAGRPAMGKTALATNLAFNAAYTYKQTQGAEGAVVGFFSLEMSSEQLAARILSEQSNISSNMMRKGELTDDEFSRLVMASQTLHQIPIFIDDTPALTVSALRSRARRLKRQHELGLIVVDYLQLISGSSSSRNDGRVQEVSEITRGLKTLAKELKVPVLALSQLSRQVENREDKRPQLADLRESGSIEQDADIVMFIYRDEYYLEKSEPKQRADESGEKLAQRLQNWSERLADKKNKAEVIVAKQRHGPVGMLTMMFDGQYTRFGDLDERHVDDRHSGP